MDLVLYADSSIDLQSLEKKITIPSGQRFEATLQQLFQAGMIKNPFKFKLLARIKGYDKRIQAGEYLLLTSTSPIKILEKLVSGKVRLHRLTIPEGYTLAQIAATIEENGWGSQSEFLSLTKDPEFIVKLGFDAKTAEGYLFPDTYYFSKDTTLNKIAATMADRFKAIFKTEWEKRAKELGFSIHQVITLASIIEKETGAPFERPLISSVFHNRLKKRMRLESDPTVIYGIEDFNGNITRKHLNTFTPYNTYKVFGLPPGPIASPGIKAIEAALYPADTEFIFFVSKKDNTHHFSTNTKDHERAVRKYQLRR